MVRENIIYRVKQRIVQAGGNHSDMHDAGIEAALQMEMEGAQPPVSSDELIRMRLTVGPATTPRYAKHNPQPKPPTS